jgi:hypothetical protein
LILLALLWVCCKDDKGVLGEYYKALQAGLGKAIFLDGREPDWKAWSEQKFDPRDVSEMLRCMQDIVKDDMQLATLKENGLFYENFVYLNLIPGKYPNLSAYQRSQLWFNGKQIAIASDYFSNCMEAAMMNLICILAYNPDEKKFNLKYLDSKLKGLTLNSKLIDFFSSNHPALKKNEEVVAVVPESIGSIDVHNAWTDVVSNIPGVAYHDKSGAEQIIEGDGYSKGFVIVEDDFMDSELGHDGYVPVRNNICFALQPTLKNLIVVLNYILGLNLYSNDDVYKEILRPDFIKTYLPKVSEKLRIVFDLPVSLDEIDAKDFGEPIITPLRFEQGESAPFKLLTSYRHGELQPQPIQFEDGKVVNLVAKRLPYYSDNIPCLRGLRLNGLDKAGIKKGSWITDKNINWSDLYWFNISGLSECQYLLFAIESKRINVNDKIEKMFMRIVGKQPNELSKISLYCSMVWVFSNPILTSQAIEIASKGLASNNVSIRASALNLFKALFKAGHGLKAAKKFVREGIASNDSNKKASALELLTVLVGKGHGFEVAITIAREAIASKNSSINAPVLNLLTALVKQGQDFPEVKKAAKKGLEIKDYYIRETAMKLLIALVKKDQCFTEGESAAKNGIKSKDYRTMALALKLLEELVKKHKGFKLAKTSIKIGLQSENENIKALSSELDTILQEYEKIRAK